jgi:WD40 repeat protein
MKRVPLLLLVWAALCPHALGNEPPPAVDRFGDPLPRGAVARLGFVRTGSNSPLNSGDGPLAAFSPDGRYFASACYSRIYLWEMKTGRVKQRFQIGDDQVGRLVFTDGGKVLLAQARAGRLHAWELGSGRETRRDVKGMVLWGTTLLSPRGRWLIDARGDVWDLAAARKVAAIAPLRFNKGRISAAFSADERRLFISLWEQNNGKYEHRVEQWDVATGKRQRVFEGLRGGHLAGSPDGRTLAVTLNVPDPKVVNKHTYTIALFDTEAGREALRLPEGTAHFQQPVFSPDGKLFAALAGWEVLHLWDTATGKTRRTWPYRLDHLRWLAFSPDGQWLGACGHGGTAILWNVATGRSRLLSEEVPYRVTDLLFSGGGKQLVAGYSDGSIRFWDLATQTVRHKFRYGDSPAYSAITNLCWAGPAGTLIFHGHKKPPGEFRLFDPKTGLDTPLSLGKGVEVHAVSAGSRTLIVGTPQAGQRDFQWKPLSAEQLQTARREAQRRPEFKGFRLLAPTPVKEKNRAYLGGFGKGERFVPTRVVALSPDGKYLVESVSTLGGSPDTGRGTYWTLKGLRLVDATTARVACEFPRTQQVPVFAPDGRALVCWKEADKKNELELLESRTGRPRWRVPLGKPVGAVTVSPCGRWLAVTEREGDALHLLEATTGKRVREHKPGRLYNGMDPLAFSPDGKRLARSAADGTVLLWQVPASPPPPAGELTAEEVGTAWRDLASADAAEAFQALLRLAAAPRSALPRLRKELLQEDDGARIKQLVADLNSGVFAKRQRASSDLEALGLKARPYLVKALRPDTPLEARRRLERLLAGLADPFATATGLRQLRAIEALERIGSAEARRVLEQLADGTPEDPLCREARLTVERLQR